MYFLDLLKNSDHNEIREVHKWIVDLCRWRKPEPAIEVTEYHDDHAGLRCILHLHTEKKRYRIYLRIHQNGKTYMGGSYQLRRYNIGEDWFRGNDLTDGPISHSTWERLKSDIINSELEQINVKVLQDQQEGYTNFIRVLQGGIDIC